MNAALQMVEGYAIKSVIVYTGKADKIAPRRGGAACSRKRDGAAAVRRTEVVTMPSVARCGSLAVHCTRSGVAGVCQVDSVYCWRSSVSAMAAVVAVL